MGKGVSQMWLLVTVKWKYSHLVRDLQTSGHRCSPVQGEDALFGLIPHKQHVILHLHNVVCLTEVLREDMVQVFEQLRVVPFECVQVQHYS